MKSGKALIYFVFLLTEVATMAIYGQSLPREVADFLQKVEKRLVSKTGEITFSTRSYWFTTKEPSRYPTEEKILWEPNGKFIHERREKERKFLFIFDGKTFWTYRADKKLYRSIDVPPNDGTVLRWHHTYLVIPPSKNDMEKLLKEGKRHTNEEISLKRAEFKGKSAYILSFKSEGGTDRSNKKVKVIPGQTIYWIDAKTYLPLFVQKIDDIEVTEFEIKKISLNPSIPNDAFKFSPPPDAREGTADEVFPL